MQNIAVTEPPCLTPIIEKSLKKGAEAEIFLARMLEREVIVKKRVAKGYRIAALDEALRRERTKNEARLIADARAFGVSTPIIYDIDLDNFTIVMQHVTGMRLKEYFNSCADDKDKSALAYQAGTSIGKLHAHNIVHGDLTTSNMLLYDGKVYFIDFSLGGKTSEDEDKGVDLHVLLEAFQSTHSNEMRLFDDVLAGYKDAYDRAEAAITKMRDIAKRGRYA